MYLYIQFDAARNVVRDRRLWHFSREKYFPFLLFGAFILRNKFPFWQNISLFCGVVKRNGKNFTSGN